VFLRGIPLDGWSRSDGDCENLYAGPKLSEIILIKTTGSEPGLSRLVAL